MGLQVAWRQACPLSGPALGMEIASARSPLAIPHSCGMRSSSAGNLEVATAGKSHALQVSKGLSSTIKFQSVVRKGLTDGKSGHKGFSGNGPRRKPVRSMPSPLSSKSVLKMVTIHCASERNFAVSSSEPESSNATPLFGLGESKWSFRRRQAGMVHAVKTTQEAYETLAELEKRLDEEAGEYDEEEYYEVVPDKRRIAKEPVQKVMNLSWLWLLEELPAGKRSRPDEFVREHWRWTVEAFLNYAFGDNWPGRLALLTRSGELALFPLNFQAHEIPDFEQEIERLELQSIDSSGKMQVQSKRRLEKEKQRIREKLQEQWTDSERLRAGEVRSFLSEKEEARLAGFWARFEERFGADWKERLQWEKESGQWKLDGDVVQPAEELATLVFGAEWLQRAQQVHGIAWWKEIQEGKSEEFWTQRFQQSDALVAYFKEKQLWPHRVWMHPKDEVGRVVKAGKKWAAIWTYKKEISDEDAWLRFDEGDKEFHREEQLTLRKYPKGLVELEMNLDKEPEYVELKRQHLERQLEKKEWTFGALPDAFSRLYMVDGRFTTAADEEEKRRKAEAPPVYDVRLPHDYHLEPNPMRDASGRPRDFYIFPRNCRVPKSWPPPGWEVPADELAFLREGESQRDYFARAAQQAIDKLGVNALDVVKQSGDLVTDEEEDQRWKLFLKQYHEWREANLERLDKEGKEMDAFIPKGYDPGRRRVGKWMELPTADPEVKGMYELPFLEQGQVYEGFVTSVDLHAGALVAHGGVHDGWVPILGKDWDFGNLWDMIEVGTKCVVEVVAVRNPFRFRFPVEMRFLDPDITPLLVDTKKERAEGAPIIARREDLEIDEVWFESGRKRIHGPRERGDETLTAYDLETMQHPDQDWIQRKGVVEQRLLANEEYETAMASGTPLPFPILYDWDYIADPNKRLELLKEQEKTAKLTDKGRSNLPRDEKHFGELMEDNKEHGVSVSSMVTIDSVTETMTEEEKRLLDMESARRDREGIREQILYWLEEAELDWTALTGEEFDSLWDELEETRPLFPWEAEVQELYSMEVAYYQSRLLAHEEYDAEVKLRGLWNETPYKLPEIVPFNRGEKEERPTPVMMNDRLKREKWGDAERPFPDIPSRKEEWRAENARLAARMRQNSELQKEAEAAAKAAEKAAERRAAGMEDAIDGDFVVQDDEEERELTETEDEDLLDDELDVVT